MAIIRGFTSNLSGETRLVLTKDILGICNEK